MICRTRTRQLYAHYKICCACFPFQYYVLFNVLLTYIMLPMATLCFPGPIDCPTVPTTTSRVLGGAQCLNAFAVIIPGWTTILLESFDPIATMDFIIFLIVSGVTILFMPLEHFRGRSVHTGGDGWRGIILEYFEISCPPYSCVYGFCEIVLGIIKI